MAVNILIRNVSEHARDVYARRAEAAGQSMQEYLREKLEADADGMTIAEWVEMIESRTPEPPDPGVPSTVEILRKMRDDG